ncbi:SCO7613 C-terminal domain-containing membrane protein [Clavibacter nebraskensis]|uniref:SCO7613 C-terminal domain-containing membrane protein n=1 Tax=Clavibacter nebraskensis TaxID=31963 RepID=UPI00200BEE3D|nr:hypothetical protein [Clavibacter nebraskensis]UQB17635.1 hypothetical protein LIX22_001449 [Clavibacter nebraskensis]
MVEDDARASGIGAQPWAARPLDLLRTELCPACFAPLGAFVCARCGLDVRAPEAAALLGASRRVVDAITERERLLEAMRRWSDAAARARAAAVVAPAAPDSSSVPVPVLRDALATATTIAPDAATDAVAPPPSPSPDAPRPQQAPTRMPHPVPPAPAAPRRRISVPAVLLAIGVVLLSVAAVFYVVYAFVTYGLVVRAAITAAVTLATLGAAAVLARRRLPGTAEAVGVVGVVLLHLDVWAVRSYDLAGAASNDPFVHFGVGTLVVYAAILVLRPLLRIRTAGIAGWAGLSVGAGLLVGAVPSSDAGTRTALALAAASAVALVHAAPRSRAANLPDPLERRILRVVGVGGAAAALLAGAAAAIDPDAVPALPLLVAAVASGAHAWALARAVSPDDRVDELRRDDVDRDIAAPAAPADAPVPSTDDGAVPDAAPVAAGHPTDALRILAAVVAGVGAAAALPVTVLTGGPAMLTFCAQLVAAALAAAVLDVAARRLPDAAVAGTARVAALAALVVAAVAGLPAAIAGLGGITAALVVGLPAWAHDPLDDTVGVLARTSDVAGLSGDVRAGALGLVAVWVLAAVAAVVGRRSRERRSLLAWTGAAALIAAIPALGPVAVVVAAYLVASAGALAWRLSSRRAAGPAAIPPAPLTALSLVAGALAGAASWASTSTWWAAAPILVLLLVVGSQTARTEHTARLATAGAALAGLVSAGALAPSLTTARVIGDAPASSALDAAADPVVLVLLASGLTVLVAGALPGRPGLRRRALLATVLLPACLTALLVAIVGADRVGGALTGSPACSIAAQVTLVAGLVAWTVGGAGRVALPERALRPEPEAEVPRAPGTTALRRWRLTTAALVAPTLLLAVLTAGALVDRGATPHGVVPAAVTLVVATAALLARRHASRALRVALDVGTTAVAIGSLVVAVSVDPTLDARGRLWVPLLLLAAAALAMSIAHDGLLLSRSARRAWGWTALGAGIAALWSRLLAGGTTSSEAYWLPVAGALLLLAALMHHAAVRADGRGMASSVEPRVRRGVTTLTLAGILTAVLPLAAVGRPDDVLRPYLLTGICAALALGGAAALRHAASPVRPLLRAVVIGAGIGLLVVGGTRALRLSAGDAGREPAVDLQLTITAALLVGVGVLVLRGARNPADARLAGSAWAGTTALVAVVLCASVGTGEGVVRPLVASVALVAGAGALLVLRSVHRHVLAVSAAAALLGAVVVAFLAWRGGYASVDAAAVAVPAIVAVLVAAVGSADRLRNPVAVPVGPSTPDAGLLRHSADLATGVLVAGTVAVGASTDAAGLPVALLLSAVAVLIASTPPGSRARRHVGWIALVLDSAALWVPLGRGRVDAVEPYVLPPAGVMLAVAALLHRGSSGRPRDVSPAPGRASGAAPVLFGALLLAALPTAVASWTGTPVRALVLGITAAAVLLLCASALRGTGPASPTRPLVGAAAAASALTVPLVGFGRAVAQLVGDQAASFSRTDLWTLAAAVVLVLAVGLLPSLPEELPGTRTDARRGTIPPAEPVADRAPAASAHPGGGAPADALLRAATRATVLVALVGAGGAGTAGILRAHAEGMHDAGPRAALLVGLVAALHVVCSSTRVTASTETETAESRLPAAPPSQDRVLAIAALVVGGLVAAVLVATGAADPAETVTVPVAAALLVVGARRLLRDASAGSMRHLAPGLLVLLVPPLLADLGPSPAWRIVGLGVLALATLLVGTRLKLRAPFLIGAVVLVVHAVAQLWPWIREASSTVPWWAWAGIGGVVLIAVAARYERRIRDVKEVAARVSALR